MLAEDTDRCLAVFAFVNMFKKQTTKQQSLESVESVESQYDESTLVVDDEPLEKAKVRAPPGINASLVMLYGIFLLMFVVGIINLNNCPINPLIPIYLIVAASLGALAKSLSKVNHQYVFNVAIVLIILDVIWQVFGTIWVFKEYQPQYDVHETLYCDRTTFLLSFWILVIQYTLIGLFIVSSLCYLMMRGGFEKQ